MTKGVQSHNVIGLWPMRLAPHGRFVNRFYAPTRRGCVYAFHQPIVRLRTIVPLWGATTSTPRLKCLVGDDR